jgi:thiamine-monophosphate kinase
MSLDEFTPEEDHFTDSDPRQLGRNLAVATVSDILAAGAEPSFYMHAVSLGPGTDMTFASSLMEGVADVLDTLGAHVCGGDVGVAQTWRYCGFAMGPVTAPAPLTRRIPEGNHQIWVTGSLGDANLAILQNTPTPAFELRNREAAIMREYATACIDTSGGLMDALWLLNEQNPSHCFEIDVANIPLVEGVDAVARSLRVPAEAVLLAGAGEYELLITLPDTAGAGVDAALHELGATCIGAVTAGGLPGLRLVGRDGTESLMKAPPPCARSAESVEAHVQEVCRMAVALFGEG